MNRGDSVVARAAAAGCDFYPPCAVAASKSQSLVHDRLIRRPQNLDVALAIEPGAPRPP